ncbi:Putative acyltransferase and hydrolase with the alpha/beta hydrolase fold [Giardia duodenalis]|uniref:Putative acyltransferase and hydrolase with the alpha/beta hydrolase fold n=1 Tax=Giardia intestinalis TaxID=5741 RepID=V6TWI0_GIAIN|nr:Putative acyltransferase and hydrolase with the alpha/beta hydrolase fold [Giardia intestinalis]
MVTVGFSKGCATATSAPEQGETVGNPDTELAPTPMNVKIHTKESIEKRK